MVYKIVGKVVLFDHLDLSGGGGLFLLNTGYRGAVKNPIYTQL